MSEGNPGPPFEVVGELQLARLTMEDWQQQRNQMVVICTHGHSGSFAQAGLQTSDELLREADIVFANSVNTIKDL